MEKQLEQVSLKEAANYLGVSEYHLRQALKLGKYPFGVCIEGEKRSEFKIYKKRLIAYGEAMDIRGKAVW